MHLRTLLVDQQQSVTQAYTKNHVHPRMEDLAIGHVPIPHAQLAGFQRQAQACLAFMQRSSALDHAPLQPIESLP